MGTKLAGHQYCLICHPDLDPAWRKRGLAKGMKRIKVSDARRLQDSIEDLLDEAVNDVDFIDESAA